MPGCKGRGRKVLRFLQTCLLVILHREGGHGYALLQGLEAFGFSSGSVDSSLVYRALREMEAAGLVASEWSHESLGPRRRVYDITRSGEAALGEWIGELKRTREEIDRLVAAYEGGRRKRKRG